MKPFSAVSLTLVSLASAFAQAAEPAYRVLPTWINQNQQVQFDEQGQFQRASGNLSVRLKLIPPPGVSPLGCKGIKVTAARSNAGEDLTSRDNGPWGVETYGEDERKNQEFGVEVPLRGPKQAIQEISVLTGTITLELPKGQAKQAQIGPIKDWFGKPMLFEALNESLVVARKDKQITLNGSNKLFEQIIAVVFLDGAGLELPKELRDQDEDNGERTHHYEVNLPDDGALRIIMRGETIIQEVPFSLEHLTLRPTPPPAGQVLKVKLEDIPAAAPLPPVKVVNPDNQPAKF